MELGIFAKTFARPVVEDVFAAVAQRGFRCIQFNFSSVGLPTLPEAIEPALVRRVRFHLDANELRVAGVSGTFNLIHPDEKQRRLGMERLEVLAGACECLGTRLISLCTGSKDPEDMWRFHPENDAPASWEALTQSVSEALVIAEHYGLYLGIEPEIGNVVNSVWKARRLLDEFQSPHLKIILDPANLLMPEEAPRLVAILDEAFDLLGAELVMAHAKELSPRGEKGERPLGSGLLDFRNYLGHLRQIGFEGPLILHGMSESQVESSLDFIRGHLQN